MPTYSRYSSPKRPEIGIFFSHTTSFITGQTDQQMLAAAGSGISYFLTDVSLHATNTAGTFTLTESPDGTSVNVFGPINVAATHIENFHFLTPLKITANASLRLTTSGVAGHTVMISGYKV